MSSENGDHILRESPAKTIHDFQQKKSKIAYSRDFLLSFSVLDICKKLPDGFDASVLSEFEDASSSASEQQRSLGGLFLQSSRRYDYGSLPVSRLDSSSSFSRGSSGRWDTRSSGSSDRDGDIQSDRDMQDSGSRFGNQPRRSWQHSEHDGLLGSGAFRRPSGYAGASAPRGQGNDRYQLNRSSEPYQPPRPYKAVPYSRKDNTDSFNNETFGSSESTSEDRVEEERKRRASFELMRKEQQKALQDKKQNPDNQKETLGTNVNSLFEKSADSKSKKNEEKSDVSTPSLLLQSDSSRFPTHAQPPASRPLVPPGFASAMLEKVESSSTSVEDGHVVTEDNIPIHNDLGKKNDSNEGLEAFEDSVGLEYVSCKTSGPQGSNGILEDHIFNDLISKKESMPKTVGIVVSQDQSASILEKLFGGALPKHNVSSSHLTEHQVVQAEEETFGLAVSKSSKFAHWFSEEENGPAEDLSSRNLFSLISSSKKVGSQASINSDDKAIQHILPTRPCKDGVSSQKPLVFSTASSIPDPHYQIDEQDSRSVLTCEDLELFILAEAQESSKSGLQQSITEPWVVLDGTEKQKADVDDCASQHLLTLLQKGANSKESISFPKEDAMASFDKLAVADINASSNLNLVGNATIENSGAAQSSEAIFLAIFGPNFKKELELKGDPVSTQRGSFDRIDHGDFVQPHGMPFPQMEGAIFPSTSGEYQGNEIVHEDSNGTVCRTQEEKAHSILGLCLGHEKSIVEGSTSDCRVGRALEIQLPEEDSLISVGDSFDPRNTGLPLFREVNKAENLLPGKTLEEHNIPLLNTILKGGGDMRTHGLCPLPVEHGSYNLVQSDNLFHHLHGGPPSQFPEPMNHMRHMFPHMDHHNNRSSQMKFMGPESIHHDRHPPFPPNLIPQHVFPNAGGPRFDPPAHHPILQHMAMRGSFQTHHPLQGLPRGAPLPPHPISHVPGYMPEMNSLHNLPLNYQQPNYGGPRMGMAGPVVGGGCNPEVLQRLIEMDLIGNHQNHPAAAGCIPNIFGPEVDMGFRHR